MKKITLITLLLFSKYLSAQTTFATCTEDQAIGAVESSGKCSTSKLVKIAAFSNINKKTPLNTAV